MSTHTKCRSTRVNIFLDESAPKPLAYRLKEHTVESVASMSLQGTQNCKLLRIINSTEFEVFITCDKNMVYQQDMTQYSFATLVLSTNDWKVVRHEVQVIRDALPNLAAGTVTYVDCGDFVPRKHRI